jgi:hypothetical protein
LIVEIVRARLDRVLAERGIDRNRVLEREGEQRRRFAEFLAGLR